MAGYTRQSVASIVAGLSVAAAPVNAEFNQLQAFASGATGHGHTGGSGDGPPIVLTTSVTGILPVANLDADLAALANNSTDGFWAHTGAGTGAARTITGTAAEITITNGAGIAGNPVFSLPTALTFTGKTVTGGSFSSITLSGTTQLGNTTLSGSVTGGSYASAAFNGTLGSTTPSTVIATSGSFSSTLTALSLIDASGASAGQIKFPASQNASVNANTLDDYKEGTFTPVLTFGGASVGITYNAQEGKYTKIGNVIFFQLWIWLISKGSSVGAALISLPFTSSALPTVNAVSAGSPSAFTGLTGALNATIALSSATVTLAQSSSTGCTNLTDTSFTNGTSIAIGGCYFV